jgi:hypothetical protein
MDCAELCRPKRYAAFGRRPRPVGCGSKVATALTSGLQIPIYSESGRATRTYEVDLCADLEQDAAKGDC